MASSVQLIQCHRFHNAFAKFHTPKKSPAFIPEDLLAMNPPQGLQTSSSLAQPVDTSYFGVSCFLACGGQLEFNKINGQPQL